MRITFVLPYAGLFGGIRVAAIYARRLQQRGHRVVVVSTPPVGLSVGQRIWSVLRGRGWPRKAKWQQGPSHLDGLDVEHRVVRHAGPVLESDVPDADVVVATFWKTADWAAAFTAAKGAKVYFIQGYETLPGEFDPRIDATWRAPFQKIVISRWLEDLSVSRFNDHQAVRVPNSVDRNQFHAPPRGKQTHPTIGLLYSPYPTKGVDIALRAVELARRETPDIKLVAFGGIPQNAELPLPRHTRFILRPPQASIRDIYAGCDVWLCGSRREGFHLPLLEAMACRCPVVSTRVGGAVDIVQDGKNGYVVDPEDAASLSARVLDVLRLDEARWRAMSDAALATAERYTWDDAAALFEKGLERAVERAARGEIAGGVRRPQGVA